MVSLQNAERNLWRRLRRVCSAGGSGLDATLRRGDESDFLRVVPGNSTTEVTGGGVVYTTREADFISALAEVKINGHPTTLRANDRLEIFGHQFEILPTGGERHYDPAGNYGILMRIHTKWLGPIESAMAYMVHDVNQLFVRDASGQFAITKVNAVAN